MTHVLAHRERRAVAEVPQELHARLGELDLILEALLRQQAEIALEFVGGDVVVAEALQEVGAGVMVFRDFRVALDRTLDGDERVGRLPAGVEHAGDAMQRRRIPRVQGERGGVPGVGFLEVPGAPERLGVQREVLGADGGGDQRRLASCSARPKSPTRSSDRTTSRVACVLSSGSYSRARTSACTASRYFASANSCVPRVNSACAGQRGSGLGSHGGHGDRRGGNDSAAQQAGAGA